MRTAGLRMSLVFATAMVARMGPVYLAAYEIVFQLFIFCSDTIDGLAVAGQTLVARHLGAGDGRRAQRLGWMLVGWGCAGGAVFGAAYLTLQQPLLGLLTSSTAVTDLVRTEAILLLVAFQPLNGIVFALDGFLLGAHDTRFLMWAMLAGRSAAVRPFHRRRLSPGVGPVRGMGGLQPVHDPAPHGQSVAPVQPKVGRRLYRLPLVPERLNDAVAWLAFPRPPGYGSAGCRRPSVASVAVRVFMRAHGGFETRPYRSVYGARGAGLKPNLHQNQGNGATGPGSGNGFPLQQRMLHTRRSTPTWAEVAIVTGGAGGLGSSICAALAEDGIQVVVADFRKDDAEALAAKLKSEGKEALAVGVDVGDKQSVAAMVQSAVDAYGQLDHQINFAGLMSRFPIAELAEEEWDRVIRVNLRGVFLCSQAAAAAMRPRKSGRIINVASGRGIAGAPQSAHYAASKGGVIAFTKSMAVEVAPDNILVNNICPGRTGTPMARAGYTEEQWQAIEAMDPMQGGLTQKDEIAGLVRYLVSDATRFVTGQTFLLRTP